MQLIDALSNLLRPYNEVIGVVGIAIGFAVSAYFFSAARRDKRPHFGVYAQTIIAGANSALQGLEVRFNDIPQDRVTVSRVFFWNDGREPIRQTDIAGSDPLRIEVSNGADVLSATILAATSEACSFRLGAEPDQNVNGATTIALDFEFMNYRDGCAIQVVHNGKVSHKISLAGTLIGARELEHFSIGWSGEPLSGFWRMIRIAPGFLGMFAILAVSRYLSSEPSDDRILVLAGLATAWMVFWEFFSILLVPTVPKKLRKKVSSDIRRLAPPEFIG